jgi:hypothetical protein
MTSFLRKVVKALPNPNLERGAGAGIIVEHVFNKNV